MKITKDEFQLLGVSLHFIPWHNTRPSDPVIVLQTEAVAMAAPYLLRSLPLRTRLHHHHLTTVFFAQLRRSACTASAESTGFEELAAPPSAKDAETALRVKEPPQLRSIDVSDYRIWKDKEREIMRDIEPISLLTKEILHSNRYKDGERLTAEDEKAVIDKLLAHHPHSEDKIGCGLDSIIVDRHPQFRCSRCLFVVRSDGGWIDFSYQKCLREYIRLKYPSHAERFIREHFKRGG